MNSNIIVKDGPDTIAISFNDIEKYHGQAAIAMVAVTFKALQAAFAVLSPHAPPRREDIRIISGHPGPGVRDTFEMVTRAVTRGAYTVDTARTAARLSSLANASYGFDIRIKGERRVEISLKPGILPERFFDLQDRQRRKVATDAEREELVQLKRTIVAQVLPRPAEGLFDIELCNV